MVATVGKIQVAPGAGNVIPGQVDLSLDLRHQEDALREEGCRTLHRIATQISERRGVKLDWQNIQASRTVFCSPILTQSHAAGDSVKWLSIAYTAQWCRA